MFKSFLLNISKTHVPISPSLVKLFWGMILTFMRKRHTNVHPNKYPHY